MFSLRQVSSHHDVYFRPRKPMSTNPDHYKTRYYWYTKFEKFKKRLRARVPESRVVHDTVRSFSIKIKSPSKKTHYYALSLHLLLANLDFPVSKVAVTEYMRMYHIANYYEYPTLPRLVEFVSGMLGTCPNAKNKHSLDIIKHPPVFKTMSQTTPQTGTSIDRLVLHLNILPLVLPALEGNFERLVDYLKETRDTLATGIL